MCAVPRTGTDRNGSSFPDTQGDTVDENNWLRSSSNELYLWYNEIVDVDPADYATPEYFEQMQTFDTTASGARKDKFHFTIPTDVWLDQSQGGISGGYGATFAILQGSPPRQIVVAYTEPDTPATSPEVNLLRGTAILEVDGEDLVNGNDVDTLNNGLFPGDNETHTFVVQDAGADTTRTISITSAQIVSTPVQNVSTIETSSGVVGYMTFNDHIRTAETQLIEAIVQLQASSITDLILDIRYNGGGYLDIANELSYMIAGDSAAGQIFEELEFNDQHPEFNPITGARLFPTEFHTTTQGFSESGGTPLPALGLARVFVLTGSGTCSASESIINSLRGIDVEVIQVGATSCGKPYGFYPLDNCGTTYFSIQFRGINQKGFGDYTDGFSPSNTPQIEGEPIPGCLVSDDFTRQLGDPQEGRLRAALQYREDGTCPTIVGSSSNQAVSAAQPLNAADGVIAKTAWQQSRIIPL
ncbi:MAG: peptidase [Gammaproteobacteria bacterium]|nr:peptidase [Gammaproteobacteria bacterium]